MTSRRQREQLFPHPLELDTIFVQVAPGRLLVGHGPFERSALRDPTHPSFYVNDFFLTRSAPWHRPARWEEVDSSSLAGSSPPQTNVSWDEVSRDRFEALFEAACSSINEGLFTKIVPILFQTGVFDAGPAALRTQLLSRMAELPPSLHAYGAFGARGGLIGASPEILFQKEGSRLRTMALAGTRSLERADQLLSNPKERAEHQMVVDDIVAQLAGAGVTSVGPTEVRRYPNLAHLSTVIEMTVSAEISFEDAVKRLHPTAALGSWPRSGVAREWLQHVDESVGRGVFGAPFGIAMPDDSALCLVAIRNVEWSGSHVRIGAGGGILKESVLQQELEEQQRKREQVKMLFGLVAKGK